MTNEEQDLVRWLYCVPGFSQAKLARDFGCSIAEVEEIVSKDLARVLNPQAMPETQPKPVVELGKPLRQEATKRDYELFRRAAATILSGC